MTTTTTTFTGKVLVLVLYVAPFLTSWGMKRHFTSRYNTALQERFLDRQEGVSLVSYCNSFYY